MPAEEDIKFMREALKLAEKTRGLTSPDPMVGAVIVKNRKIISTGYHAEATTPHAESWAIKKAGKYAFGATMYVNLEPCCFFVEKNNPPCTQAIINSGIKRVVAAIKDPNPSVSGKGFKELKEAGIEVVVGVLEEEAKILNEVFIKYITTKRPYVILKAAMSLDGKIATKTGESFWITSIEARKKAHHLRNIVDGIIIGVNSAIKDNPELTVREFEGKTKNPKKIVLDPMARININSKILKIEPENAIIVVSNKAPKQKIKKLKAKKANIIVAKSAKGRFNLDLLLKDLGERKITSILIEGGGNTNALAIASGIVDKVVFFIAPKLIGGEKAKTPLEGEGEKFLAKAVKLKNLQVEKVGDDIMAVGYIELNRKL